MENYELTMLEEQLLDEYERCIRIRHVYEDKNKYLPNGSISRKIIHGKIRYYLQWREGDKIRSKYVKADEVAEIEQQIEKRRRNDENIRSLKLSQKMITRAFGKKRLMSIINSRALLGNEQAISLMDMLEGDNA